MWSPKENDLQGFSFYQIGELRCLQAKQNKLRHWNSFLKCGWCHGTSPAHGLCTPGHCWDTANGTHGTKGKVISREWLLLQLDSRQVISWVSVHFLSVFKPAPNLPRPHSMAVPFFLSFLPSPFCRDCGLFWFTQFLSSQTATGQARCCQGYGQCMWHRATKNNPVYFCCDALKSCSQAGSRTPQSATKFCEKNFP